MVKENKTFSFTIQKIWSSRGAGKLGGVPKAILGRVHRQELTARLQGPLLPLRHTTDWGGLALHSGLRWFLCSQYILGWVGKSKGRRCWHAGTTGKHYGESCCYSSSQREVLLCPCQEPQWSTGRAGARLSSAFLKFSYGLFHSLHSKILRQERDRALFWRQNVVPSHCWPQDTAICKSTLMQNP